MVGIRRNGLNRGPYKAFSEPKDPGAVARDPSVSAGVDGTLATALTAKVSLGHGARRHYRSRGEPDPPPTDRTRRAQTPAKGRPTEGVSARRGVGVEGLACLLVTSVPWALARVSPCTSRLASFLRDRRGRLIL